MLFPLPLNSAPNFDVILGEAADEAAADNMATNECGEEGGEEEPLDDDEHIDIEVGKGRSWWFSFVSFDPVRIMRSHLNPIHHQPSSARLRIVLRICLPKLSSHVVLMVMMSGESHRH